MCCLPVNAGLPSDEQPIAKQKRLTQEDLKSGHCHSPYRCSAHTCYYIQVYGSISNCGEFAVPNGKGCMYINATIIKQLYNFYPCEQDDIIIMLVNYEGLLERNSL